MRLGVPTCRNEKLRYNNQRIDITIPNTHSSELAEFVGILLGDGNITATQIMVTLGTKEEAYVHYVAALMQRLFHVPARVAMTNKGHHFVYIGSTKLVSWFLQMGLARNKKEAQVAVPDWILADQNYARAALRGLFDTDGSVYKLKFGAQISFCNTSVPLLANVHTLLVNEGFHPSKVCYPKVYLTRRQDILRFYDIIGFANPKHQKKWVEFVDQTN